MSDPPAISVEELATVWDSRGIDLATVVLKDDGTILPHSRARTAEPSGGLATLPSLLAPGSDGAVAQFEPGEALGEGGMGIVRAARQTALDRDVAVKSPRPGTEVAGSAGLLLREARVTGAIEHPNVVPVYALGRGRDDQPLLVMKRIEGTSWEDLIDRDRADAALDQSEYLERHLRILIQVAHAVHFAHARGVLHRDLKPENVMIGGFGEIYLVDWGIAVSLRAEGGIRGLPRAKDIDELAGSPAYMPPEMAAGDGETIGVRTDVYLLGATLHHVLTGEPPHQGQTLREILDKAFGSEPRDYGPEVPPRLAAICHYAMARLPEERPADAASFGEAVADFLTFRTSISLSDEAMGRLAALREAIGTVDASDERQMQSLYGLFCECRFAFGQALRTWEDNDAARQGLQEALEQMIGFELAHGSAGAAAALLPELPSPRPELAAKVEAARAAQRRTRARLEQLERDADMRIGARLRGLVTFALAIVWSVVCVACGVLTVTGVHAVGQLEFAGLNAAVLGILLAVSYLRRKTLRANEANRRITNTATLVFACHAVLWLTAYALGLSVEATTAMHMLMGSVMWLLGGLNVDRDWLAMSIGLAVGFAAGLVWPSYGYVWLGLGGGLGAVAMGWKRWRRPRRPSVG